MGFVQEVDEVPLHGPVALQLLWCVTAMVPPAESPCHSLSWTALPSAPLADTSLEIVPLRHPQCKRDRIVHVPSVCQHCPRTGMESFVSLHLAW